MGLDRKQSMLIEYQSKLAAKKAANMTKDALEILQTTGLAKTLAITAITVSEGTTSTLAAEAAVGGAEVAVAEIKKPALGVLFTTTIGQSTQIKEDDMAERVKVANDKLSEDTIYTCWNDFG